MGDSRACARDPDAALGIVDHLRCRFARLKLCAYFLQARSKFFNLLLQLLHFAVLCEEFVEQHRVHLVVAYAVDLKALDEALGEGVELVEAGTRQTQGPH